MPTTSTTMTPTTAAPTTSTTTTVAPTTSTTTTAAPTTTSTTLPPVTTTPNPCDDIAGEQVKLNNKLSEKQTQENLLEAQENLIKSKRDELYKIDRAYDIFWLNINNMEDLETAYSGKIDSIEFLLENWYDAKNEITSEFYLEEVNSEIASLEEEKKYLNKIYDAAIEYLNGNTEKFDKFLDEYVSKTPLRNSLIEAETIAENYKNNIVNLKAEIENLNKIINDCNSFTNNKGCEESSDPRIAICCFFNTYTRNSFQTWNPDNV